MGRRLRRQSIHLGLDALHFLAGRSCPLERGGSARLLLAQLASEPRHLRARSVPLRLEKLEVFLQPRVGSGADLHLPQEPSALQLLVLRFFRRVA